MWFIGHGSVSGGQEENEERRKFIENVMNSCGAEKNQFDAPKRKRRRCAMIWNHIIHIKVYKNLLFYMMNFYIITKEGKKDLNLLNEERECLREKIL